MSRECPPLEYPQEIELLHEGLLQRYDEYHICKYHGFLYHVLIHHVHFDGDQVDDYIMIADHEMSGPATVRLFDITKNGPLFMGTLEWSNPNFFTKLFAHLDKYIKPKT